MFAFLISVKSGFEITFKLEALFSFLIKECFAILKIRILILDWKFAISEPTLKIYKFQNWKFKIQKLIISILKRSKIKVFICFKYFLIQKY